MISIDNNESFVLSQNSSWPFRNFGSASFLIGEYDSSGKRDSTSPVFMGLCTVL
jgi:hypothetical protein